MRLVGLCLGEAFSCQRGRIKASTRASASLTVAFLIKSLWFIEYRLEINGINAGWGCVIYCKSTTLQLLYIEHENFDWWSKCTFPWIAYLDKCEAHQWEMWDNRAIHEPLQALPASQICGATKRIKKTELLEWTFPAFDRSEDLKRDQCLAIGTSRCRSCNQTQPVHNF